MEITMDSLLPYAIVLFLCMLIGGICFWGKRRNRLIGFFLQGMLSVGLLWGAQKVIAVYWIESICVPVTPTNLSICFLAGIPGLALLYGIRGIQYM